MTMLAPEWTVERRALRTDAPSVVEMAEANASLAGNWKYVIEAPHGDAGLRNDAFVPAGGEEAAGAVEAGEWIDRTKARLERNGYACHIREGRLSVQWEDGVRMEAAHGENGETELRVAMSVTADEGTASGEAMALYLLRASGAVRLARGFLEGGKAGFLVRVAGGGGDEVLQESVSALGACCRLFLKSLGVLRDEETARRYLVFAGAWNQSTQAKGEQTTCSN